MRSTVLITRLTFVALALLLTACQVYPQTSNPADDVAAESLRFTAVYGAMQQNFADSVDPDRAIFDGGIRGMLSILDPFSAFFDREQFELLQQQARGEALGFGSILYVTPGKVLVLQTAEGSPSWRAGLGPGDEIVSLNGERVSRLDFRSLVELLQRSRSHPVRLGVIHPGKVVSQDFELKPAEVAVPTVDKAFRLSARIGYIHLTGFELKTPQEVLEALKRLDAPRLQGLLLDLRDNHGGIVDAAVNVASLFLKRDLLVLTMRGRAMLEKVYRTIPIPQHVDLPLVVLVNGNTASSAEVLAAALQEHDRAVIAGEPTFGKGVVQSVTGLSEKTGLALTTAQYFTSSGRSIQRPLPASALATDQSLDAAPDSSTFHTDCGRLVSAGGGISPDVTIPARAIDPWLAFLNQRGTFTSFASEFLTLRGRVTDSFEPTPADVEAFRDFLARNRIRTPEEYWDQDQDYMRLRIKTELFNLVFGLTRGDEVEAKGDPQVRDALSLFPRITQLLHPPAAQPATIRVKRVAE